MLIEMLTENVIEILDKEKNNYLKEKTIFVYCGGKSGSKTLWKSLPNSLHVHSNADFQLTRLDEDERELTIFDVIKYNMETKKRILIIDSYRSPIERKISAFFHHTLELNDDSVLQNLVSSVSFLQPVLLEV